MKNYASYGYALILGSIAALATMILHPTDMSKLTTPQSVNNAMLLLIGVHSLALSSIPLLTFGFVGLCQRIGWANRTSVLGFIYFAFAAIAVMIAAIADGLINAALIPSFLEAQESTREIQRAILNYNSQINQASAKVYVVGASISIFLCSLAILRTKTFDVKIGGFGIIAGLLPVCGLISGHLRVDAHGFGLVIALQVIWMIAIGLSMIRTNAATGSRRDT